MRRPAHGATCSPGPCRPASGYGRALGRPGPATVGAVGPLGAEESPDALDPSTYVERAGVAGLEFEAPATP